MRVNELDLKHAKHLSKNKWTVSSEIWDYLRNNGYDTIGQGSFSSIWTKPNSNSAIKVSRVSDRCWLSFAELCKTRKSPYLPKISRVIKYQIKLPESTIEQFAFIAFMEKLNPRADDSKLQSLVYKFLELERISGGYEDYQPEESGLIEKTWPGFVGLVQYINSKGRPKSCANDLTDKNICWRNGKTPVIVDPWAG